VKKETNGYTNSSTLLLNIPTTITLTNYKKNNRVTKFILLSELINLVVLQSKNYKKLYSNLIKQVNYIKIKLLVLIKEEIELENRADILLLKKKLERQNMSYTNFIELILLDNREYNSLKRRYKNEISKIKKRIRKNKLYIRYIYLKKIITYLNKIFYSKLEKINYNFYTLLEKIEKSKKVKLKIKILLTRILRTYVHKGLNIELSKYKLQSYLLRCLKKPKSKDSKSLPQIWEDTIKERGGFTLKSDNLTTIKEVLNYLVKQKYGYSYYKFSRELRSRNLENVSITELFKIFDRIENNTFFGIYSNKGLRLNIEDKLFTTSNVELHHNRVLRNNNLYYLNKDYIFFGNKENTGIYNIYNLFSSLLKYKKKDNFLSTSEKILELLNNSYLKYIYYNIEHKELDNIMLLSYNSISSLYDYMIKRKKTDIVKSKLYEKNINLKNILKRSFSYFAGDSISLYEVKGKKKKIEIQFQLSILEQLNTYIYKTKNICNNKNLLKNFSISNISIINSTFNMSDNLNQYYIYNKVNLIYIKYFSYIRKILNNNIDKLVNIKIISLLQNNSKYNSISSYLSQEILKIDINDLLSSSTDEDNINNNINNSLKKIESSLYNKSLISELPILEMLSSNNLLLHNKEVLLNKNKIENIDISDTGKFMGNLLLVSNNNKDILVKPINIQESFTNFYYKKIIFFYNLVKLSKKETNIITKNNYVFYLKRISSDLALDTNKLTKMNNSFLLDDYNRILTSVMVYTTTELEKITRYQQKRKTSKKIY